jgi:ribonuclease HIII
MAKTAVLSSIQHSMAALSTYTKPLTTAQAEKLRQLMVSGDFEFMEKPYCLYAGSRPGVNVLVYEKGPKLVIQGKGTEDFIINTLEPLVLEQAELGYEEVLNPAMFQPHIGVDESGKGDFFGPLVIAGVFVNGDLARKLREMGVMDSKRIGSDARIETLAMEMKRLEGLQSDVILIGPEKYNELYGKFKNLNRLLAWGHAKVIENLLSKAPNCPRALSDQFANPLVLRRALMEKGKAIEIEQRTKAESDPAVAAASILARHGFVSWLKEAGNKIGTEIPKGVSNNVKNTALKIVQERGAMMLPTMAKMHFKTAAEILEKAGQ